MASVFDAFFLEEILEIIQENSAILKIAFIVLSFLLLCYWIFIHPFLFFKRLGIPHVTPLTPLLGSLPQIMKEGSRKLHQRCMKQLGKVYGLYIGRRPMLVVTDTKMLEQIFVKSFSKFHNRPSFLGKKRSPMHLGMLISEYNDWRRVRLTVNPTFSAGKVKQMLPLMEEAIDTLVSIFMKISKNKVPADLHRYYGKLTMDIILSVAFGLKTDFQVKCNERIEEETAKWFEIDSRAFLIDVLPLPLFVRERLRMLLSPDPAFFVNILKPVVEERKRNPSSRRDFLQLLLTENREDGKQKLSDDDIYAQAITFLLAGYETTSNALSYTTYLLALHPHIQEKLFEEINEKFNTHPDSSVYDDIQKLEYLDQVLNESLRMYPPAYQTARLVEDDCEINGYHIPKGISVSIPIYAIHHFEEYWKDHDKFDPDRFSPENRKTIDPLHYLPFGFGPRNCIGMRFALIEAKLTLARVLKKFKFVQTAETEIPLKMSRGITMSPTNGIRVAVVPRE